MIRSPQNGVIRHKSWNNTIHLLGCWRNASSGPSPKIQFWKCA